MIDIHSHILPLVDDGSADIENSLAMLKDCYDMGITDVILTPHYRGKFCKTPQELTLAFRSFKRRIKKEKIDVNVYLGQEIYFTNDFMSELSEGKVLALNGTKHLLIECPYDDDCDVTDLVYELNYRDYVPIIAHVERFPYVSVEDIKEIKKLGGLIQVNAGSLFSKDKRIDRKKIKKLFKYNLVDFVSSDAHYTRVNEIKRAYQFVEKKYGKEVAQKVFNDNAKKIIEG